MLITRNKILGKFRKKFSEKNKEVKMKEKYGTTKYS